MVKITVEGSGEKELSCEMMDGDELVRTHLNRAGCDSEMDEDEYREWAAHFRKVESVEALFSDIANTLTLENYEQLAEEMRDCRRPEDPFTETELMLEVLEREHKARCDS